MPSAAAATALRWKSSSPISGARSRSCRRRWSPGRRRRRRSRSRCSASRNRTSSSGRSASGAEWTDSQVAPPSRVRRIVSSWPTAQPSRSSCSQTAVSMRGSEPAACTQVAPRSFEIRICPRSPTATQSRAALDRIEQQRPGRETGDDRGLSSEPWRGFGRGRGRRRILSEERSASRRQQGGQNEKRRSRPEGDSGDPAPHEAPEKPQRTPSRRRASGVKSASVRFSLKSCGVLSPNRPMTK